MPTKAQAEALDKLADGWVMGESYLFPPEKSGLRIVGIHWKTKQCLYDRRWVEYNVGDFDTISKEGLRALREYYANKTTG